MLDKSFFPGARVHLHRAYLRHCAHFSIRSADTDWSHYHNPR